jgi:hypothetical protein
MPKCVGVAFEGRLHWALPVGNSTNNEIWTLDLERGGAWMKPWNISADWMWLYNDNSGTTHFLVLQGNKIYEFNTSQMTSDDGTAFLTAGNSGLLYFSDDQREWAKLLNVVFTVLRPQGNIQFYVSAMTDEGVLTFTAGENYGSNMTVAGWSEPSSRGMSGWGRRGWSVVEAVPRVVGVASTDVIVEIDEEVKWWSYGWSSSGPGVNYDISNVVPEYVGVGLKDLG